MLSMPLTRIISATTQICRLRNVWLDDHQLSQAKLVREDISSIAVGSAGADTVRLRGLLRSIEWAVCSAVISSSTAGLTLIR